jgi:hypothetical protein
MFGDEATVLIGTDNFATAAVHSILVARVERLTRVSSPKVHAGGA